MGGVLPFEWIETDGDHRLAIMHRPPGGMELALYLGALHRLGVDVLVSMLADDEAKWMDLGEEAAACARNGLEFLRFPVEDHGVPESGEDTIAFARVLHERLEAGRSVVIHCYAGIGRSALMAITTMVVAGCDLEDAIDRASVARGFAVPESNQRAWLKNLLDPD